MPRPNARLQAGAKAARGPAWINLLPGGCWGDLLVIVVIAGLVFGRAAGFALLSWDDDQNILNNAWLAPGQWTNFWTQAYLCMYVPLVYTVWYALKRCEELTGLPLYHAVNVALHAANMGLVYLLARAGLRRSSPAAPTLDGPRPQPLRVDELITRRYALLAALLFGLHPLVVETVAWATGLRDLLSAFGALLAMVLYLGACGRRRYAASLLMFALALLAKPGVAVLPAVVLLWSLILGYDDWRAALRRLAPWFALALWAVFATRGMQRQIVDDSLLGRPWQERLLIGLDSLGFYLRQWVWPRQLAVDYGRTPAALLAMDPLSGARLLPLGLAVLALAALGASFFYAARHGPRCLAAFAVFALFTWLPTSGLIAFAYQHTSTVADHYAYLPALGLALVLAGLGRTVAASAHRRLYTAGLTLIVVVSAALSWQRLDIWQDDAHFFPVMVAGNPRSYAGWTGLAALAMRAGHVEEALGYLDHAAAIDPRKVDLLANQGMALNELGRYNDVLTLLADKLPPVDLMRATPVAASAFAKLYMMEAYAQIKTGQVAASLVNLCWAHWADSTNPDVQRYLPLVAQALGRNVDDPKLCPIVAP